jgi:peptidase C39-like protein
VLRRATLILGVTAGLMLASASPAFAVQPFPINFQTVDFHQGTMSGLELTSDGQLELADDGLGSYHYDDPFSSLQVLGHDVDGSGDYVSGSWTSPVYPLNFEFNELVSSWNSKTPPGTYIQSEVKPQLNNGRWAKWYTLGLWAYNDFVDGSGDPGFHRTSVGHQGDADGFVSIDTFFTKDHPAVSYQLRLTIYRRVGLTDADAPVRVSRYSAVASNLTNQRGTFPSEFGGTVRDLQLPPFSQETHHGEYPEFDNGGEAWCSPTSTAMVVRYWGDQYAPTQEELQWVDPNFADPEVDHTARYVYDYHYQGAGNWPFNVAYASERGLAGDVTQLHNLREAEPFIAAGIPLVASVAWQPNKLDGGIKSTNGHLMVIGGFTATGNVIAYDPASDNNGLVRHEYDRQQFERAWIPASGGIVYVIRPVDYPGLPDLTANNYR